MERVYLDNASTSWPKAPGVGQAISDFLTENGSNVNRGGYEEAYSAEKMVFEARERLARMFHFSPSRNVIFTANVTQSLNMLIKGLMRPGDHVLVSAVEHNAMMRPLVQMEQRGVSFTRIPCDSAGQLDPADIPPLLRPETKAIFTTHASNVCGTLLPVEEMGAIAAAHSLYFIVDAAQTAGVFPIDMDRMGITALAFTGHKSLLGPQGIGGLLVRDELAGKMEPLLAGGTGSLSDRETIPDFLPDRLEAGTPNLPGICGLHRALAYLEETGIDSIREREIALARRLWEGLAPLPGVRLVGANNWTSRAAIVSADFTGQDNGEIAFLLGDQYRILTRCGLHCAPHAHKVLGTFPQGTVRFSPGHRNTEAEIDYCIASVRALLEG